MCYSNDEINNNQLIINNFSYNLEQNLEPLFTCVLFLFTYIKYFSRSECLIESASAKRCLEKGLDSLTEFWKPSKDIHSAIHHSPFDTVVVIATQCLFYLRVLGLVVFVVFLFRSMFIQAIVAFWEHFKVILTCRSTSMLLWQPSFDSHVFQN